MTCVCFTRTVHAIWTLPKVTPLYILYKCIPTDSIEKLTCLLYLTYLTCKRRCSLVGRSTDEGAKGRETASAIGDIGTDPVVNNNNLTTACLLYLTSLPLPTLPSLLVLNLLSYLLPRNVSLSPEGCQSHSYESPQPRPSLLYGTREVWTRRALRFGSSPLLAPAGGAQSFDPMHSVSITLYSNEAMPFALTHLPLQVCTLLAWARAKYPLQSLTEERADRLFKVLILTELMT